MRTTGARSLRCCAGSFDAAGSGGLSFAAIGFRLAMSELLISQRRDQHTERRETIHELREICRSSHCANVRQLYVTSRESPPAESYPVATTVISYSVTEALSSVNARRSTSRASPRGTSAAPSRWTHNCAGTTARPSPPRVRPRLERRTDRARAPRTRRAPHRPRSVRPHHRRDVLEGRLLRAALGDRTRRVAAEVDDDEILFARSTWPRW